MINLCMFYLNMHFHYYTIILKIIITCKQKRLLGVQGLLQTKLSITYFLKSKSLLW